MSLIILLICNHCSFQVQTLINTRVNLNSVYQSSWVRQGRMAKLLVLGFLLIYSGVLLANDAPIIGILSQETFSVDHLFDKDYQSFIAASYVKYLESAGARVVPIFIGRDREYYVNLVNNTNGILFPGGATFFNQSDGYADAGQIIYDLAVNLNNNGDYYPIWGTCLGMELLAHVALGGREIRSDCAASKVSMPLHFKEDFRESKLFWNAPNDIIDILSTQNVTYNSHQYCLTEEAFKENQLLEDWRVMSVNDDINGFTFISTFESKKYPFYAVQFHPEKINFEFKTSSNIPHSLDAVKTSHYFANFFVEETRRNTHKYPDWKSEMEALIYNYQPHFTGLQNSSYLQLYMFEWDDEDAQKKAAVSNIRREPMLIRSQADV